MAKKKRKKKKCSKCGKTVKANIFPFVCNKCKKFSDSDQVPSYGDNIK